MGDDDDDLRQQVVHRAIINAMSGNDSVIPVRRVISGGIGHSGIFEPIP